MSKAWGGRKHLVSALYVAPARFSATSLAAWPLVISCQLHGHLWQGNEKEVCRVWRGRMKGVAAGGGGGCGPPPPLQGMVSFRSWPMCPKAFYR